MQKSREQIKIAGGDISFDMQEVFKFHLTMQRKIVMRWCVFQIEDLVLKFDKIV